MHPDFKPLIRNAHLLTIAGNFWPRKIDTERFPARRVEYRIDARTTVVAYEHRPQGAVRGEILFLHGLEGSADAGYIASCAQEALTRGFAVHRLNARTCGGTESLCETTYHSGLTADARFVLEAIQARSPAPRFVIGFSLGGNVALKLAGELGQTELISGVCAVSTPIDLAACVRSMEKRANQLYARRFLRRLRNRVVRKSRLVPETFRAAAIANVRTIWEFDDRVTAPLFGFGTAANYYATQSASRYLEKIRVPALVVTSKDDPMVPFDIYHHPAFQSNPYLKLVATAHGGHLGFIARRKPRFWLDGVAMDWICDVANRGVNAGTKAVQFASV